MVMSSQQGEKDAEVQETSVQNSSNFKSQKGQENIPQLSTDRYYENDDNDDDNNNDFEGQFRGSNIPRERNGNS